MTAPPGKDDDDYRESPFRIMDEIIYQINKTKKMFIMMILTIIVIVPISIIVIFATFGPPFSGGWGWWGGHGFGGGVNIGGLPPGMFGFNPAFEAVRLLITAVVLLWLVLGIRQWFILSKWTKKYNTYKELQKKIEDKLDFEKDEREGGTGESKDS